MSKEIIVCGQRRSGSSAVAGVLHRLGVPMGANPERSSERNPKGFFEDETFVEMSKKIIAYVDKHLKEGKSRPTAAKIEYKFEDEIKSVIDARKQHNNVWGFKDVNQIRTHKFFRKHLENPYYIFVFRNSLDTALSAYDWHGKNNPQANLGDYIIAAHEEEELQMKLLNIISGNLFLLSFDKMLREPEKQVRKIADFIPITPDKDKINSAIKHIEPQTLKTTDDKQ